MLNKNVFILNVQYMQNIYESIFDKKKHICVMLRIIHN